MRRSHLAAVFAAVALATLGIIGDAGVAAQQRAEMHDMQLVGFNDLQARASPKPAAPRWCACAMAANCRTPIPTGSTCCAPSATAGTKCGT